MLAEFRIRNFALVDDMTVSFSEGLNVLTGETGAGKSVIVTALSLALGARPAASPVRAGCDAARVDAAFRCQSPGVIKALEDAGISPDEDGTLILSREFTASGRSTARINHSMVPLSAVRAMAEEIIDLHGQYAHQAMLRLTDQSRFLDATGGAAHRALLQSMAAQHNELRELRARLQEFRDNAEALEKEADMLRFRIKEIGDLISDPEEFDKLRQEIKTLEHGQDLADAVNSAYARLRASESGPAAQDSLARARAALQPVAGVSPELDAVMAQIEEADALVDAAARSLGAMRGAFESNPQRLEELQDRMFQIKDLMKKTGSSSAAALLDFKAKSAERLKNISLDEDSITALEKQAADLEARAADTAAKLTKSRRTLADKFSKAIKSELKELAMPGAAFKAELQPFDAGLPAGEAPVFLRPSGAERVAFLFSANTGEAPKPLDQIASGGEISRVMLALKSLLSSADDVPTLVFDEIDAGIGGETAHAIARKLARLASGRQVLCVTHLAQIAAAANRHMAVSKKTQAKRTVIHAREVDGADRVREIARMLGDSGMQESHDLAQKLIEQAGEY
jgi:DNA repair protein RecN (Recombination protein N)